MIPFIQVFPLSSLFLSYIITLISSHLLSSPFHSTIQGHIVFKERTSRPMLLLSGVVLIIAGIYICITSGDK
jgi:drug/metabolite transporter (DMT)-like permease